MTIDTELHRDKTARDKTAKDQSSEFEQANFNIHGLKISVYGPTSVARDLRDDLKYFDTTQTVNRNPTELIDLKITIFAPDRRPSGLNSPAYDRLPLFFKTNTYKVFGARLPRLVEYADGSTVYVADGSPRAVRIFARSSERAYELAYLSLHSFVGEKLEKLGFTRLHALTFSHHDRTAAVLLPSTGGKSSLAWVMTQNSEFSIYADEMSLVYKKTLQPYPWRLGLDTRAVLNVGADPQTWRKAQRLTGQPKFLASIANEKVARPLALTQCYWGVASDKNQIRPPTRQEKIEFLWSVILGTGLMQMAEYVLRVDNFVALAKIAVSRLVWALKNVGHLRVVEVNRDYADALSVLGDDLNKNPHHHPQT
jgi:hypothetical protein